jgi:hypothetical protein
MQDFIAVGIVAVAIVVVSLAGRAAGMRARAASSPRGTDGELVAVIAAAVVAASGMEAGSFRVVALAPAVPSIAQRGFNTPAWGHVDRFSRGDSR